MDNLQSLIHRCACRAWVSVYSLGHSSLRTYLTAVSVDPSTTIANGIHSTAATLTGNTSADASIAAAIVAGIIGYLTVRSGKRMDARTAAQLRLDAAEHDARTVLITQYREFVTGLRERIDQLEKSNGTRDERIAGLERQNSECEGKLRNLQMSVWFLRNKLGLPVDDPGDEFDKDSKLKGDKDG